MPSTRLAPARIEPSRPDRSLRRSDVPRHRWDRPRIAVVIACLFSGVLAATLSMTVFSHLSVNNDESVYLLQAKALANGHLFPPAGHPAASFTPWLGVISGDHYVLKYTPVVAAFLAASLVLTGGYVAALVFWAVALVATTFVLTKEATGNRGTAATAAVLVAVCPLTIVQSALALPYVPFLVLAQLALWGMLAGARRRRFGLLVLSGVCGGLAFAARPFDTLLMLAPAVGWLLWKAHGRRRWAIGGLLAGAALPGGALLWFDYAATGSALRLPFSLFEPADTLGFGIHRLYPQESARHFGLAQAWQGMSRHLSLLGGGWAFGGLLLLVFVAIAFVRRQVPVACMVILAGGVLLTVGYLFFWGIWNAAIIWGATRYLGPFYLLPLLIPLSIVGAIGLRSLAANSRLKTIFVCVAASTISIIVLVPALQADAALNANNTQLANAVAAQGKSLVFVDTYPDYLQHPTPVISNSSPPGGRTVYALQRGGADFTVLSDFPGRRLYELRLLGEYGVHAHSYYGAQLQRMQIFTGRTLTLSVLPRVPESAASARLEVSVGDLHISSELVVGRPGPVQLTFSAASADGSPPPAFTLQGVQPGRDGAARVTLITRDARGRDTAHQILIALVRTANGLLKTLAPVGPATELGPMAPPPLSLVSPSS